MNEPNTDRYYQEQLEVYMRDQEERERANEVKAATIEQQVHDMVQGAEAEDLLIALRHTQEAERILDLVKSPMVSDSEAQAAVQHMKAALLRYCRDMVEIHNG